MDFSIPDYPDMQFGSVYCIGRNYAKHIEEMKSKPTTDPVVFLKPRSSLIFDKDSVIIPPASNDVHHEVELVLLIGKTTKDIEPENALASLKAVAVGIDMTARDIQVKAKKAGLPWTLSKGFDTFSPIGNFSEYNSDLNLENIDIELRVNNSLRQSGNTSSMLFKADQLISYLSSKFTLYPGDLIFTGTPEGVGRVNPGDKLSASLNHGLSSLQVDAH